MADLSLAGRWWWHWIVVAARPVGVAASWTWSHDLVLAAVVVATVGLALVLRAGRRGLVALVAVLAWAGGATTTLVGTSAVPPPAPLTAVASLSTAGSDGSRVVFRVSGVGHIPPTFNGDRVLGQMAFAVPYPPPQSPPTALPLVPDTTAAGVPSVLPGVTIHAVVPIAGLAAVVPSAHVPSTSVGLFDAGNSAFAGPGLPTLSTRKSDTVAVQAPGVPAKFGWSISTLMHSGDRQLYADALAAAHMATSTTAAIPTASLVRTDEAWIAAHMDYSRAPEHAPPGWNPVAWALLRSHHGWCAVTATAFAELWEAQTGLSADVVTGWLVPPSGVVRSKDAHAWVQVSHVRGVAGSPVVIDPTAVLKRVPPAPAPSPGPALAGGAAILALAGVSLWLHRRNPLQRLERRARRQLGRTRRPDEALGAFAVEAGLDPEPAWRVWDGQSGRR